MSITDKIIGGFASQDILDLYFILSDLVDIPITENEIVQNAHLDSICSATLQKYNNRQDLARAIEHTRKPGAMKWSKRIIDGHRSISSAIPGLSSLPLNSYGGVDVNAYNADPENKIPLGKLVL